VVNVTVSSPPAPVVVSLAPSPQTIVGRAWTNITPSARMRATGFTGAVRYRLNRALPPGLVINSTTGVISGKPRVTASGTWTMTASDGASSATAVVIIRISPKPQVPTTPVVLPPVVRPPGCTVVVKRTVRTNAGQVARVRVSASGGVGRAGEGKPDFTVVRGPGGEVWVCVTGRRAVTVTVQLTAPATIGYQAYSMAKKYMVRKLR